MIEQDFIMLIMNCKAYRSKAEFQKKTWLKYIPDFLKYYHVIGEENLEEEYQFDENNKILYVKNKDDYNSLPHKVITSYKAIFETHKFKYIFKTDDDQILVNNKFFAVITNIINNKDPKTHYGGFVIDVTTPHISMYYKYHPELPQNLIIQKTKYCSGRFYFLSFESIQYLMRKKDKISNEYLEDYAIGYYLHDYLKKNIFHISTNQYFTDIEKSDYPNLRFTTS
jgi:hypothetical protein